MRQLVFLDLDYLSMSFSATFLTVVEEYLEAQRVVLVLTQSEPVVGQQEAVISRTIAIEKLFTFSIASAVPGVHRKISVGNARVEPFFVIFIVLSRLVKDVDSLAESFLLSDLKKFGFAVAPSQRLVMAD